MNSPNLKYRAEYLHDGTGFIRDKVLVTDEKGTILDLVPEAEAGEGIQRVEGVLCPGFINTHCHLELSHMRDVVPEHTGLVNFLLTVTGSRHHPEDQIVQAARDAEQEMLDAGIVAVGDISNHTTTVPVKSRGRLHYHTFIEAIGMKDADAAARMDASLKIRDAFTQSGLETSIVPHAPYSVSESLMRAVNLLGPENIISIHNQESPEENSLFQGAESDFQRFYQALGLEPLKLPAPVSSSLMVWLPRFTQHQPVISVHNTFTTETDIRFGERSGHPLYWCLCPGANLYIENRLPAVDLLDANGSRIVLGTDSLASNHSLSILEEIRLLSRGFPSLPLERLLGWATARGAEALGLGDRFGHFQAGARPGILQLHPIAVTPARPGISSLTRVRRLK